MKDNNFNLEILLNDKPSLTSYGSEFKSAEDLEDLLQDHPRWKYLKQRLKDGVKFHLDELSEELRLKDLEHTLAQGNHQSAIKHEAVLEQAFVKETGKGWNLILPEDEVFNIPGLQLAPMGVAEQLGVNAEGKFVPKTRITHDLSFPGKESG